MASLWSSDSSSESQASSSTSSSVDSSLISSPLLELKKSIRDALYEEVPVEEFVQHVWGICNTDIERILDGKHYWNTSPTLLRHYKDVYWRMNENTLAARRAGNVFAAFLDVVEEVLQNIRIRIYDAIRPTNAVTFKYNSYSSGGDVPDISTVWDPTSKPEWPVIQTMFEFERPPGTVPNYPTNDHGAPRRTFLSEYVPSSEPTSPSSYLSSSSCSTQESCSSSDTDATNTSAGSYRNGKGSNAGHSVTSRHSKKRMNLGELRLAQKALECLSSTGRRYVTGIYVDVCSVTLWYYDRVSVIRSHSFNLELSPAYLVLVLFAISRCDVYQAGFDRFHEFSITPSGPQIPTVSFKGRRLVVPTPGASYHFQITRDKPIYASRELLGRGTVVYPIVLQPDEDEVLVNEEEQVLKLYWPSANDPAEAEIIKQLHCDIPEITDHLPSTSFSASFTRDELNLPSSLLKAYACPDIEDRLLHMFTMRRYDKLWEVDSIEEFQEVFLDCVECHHHAYKKGRVLHRDLSENNLMVWRPRTNPIEPHQQDSSPKQVRALGILNDWDMASHVIRYPGMATVVTMMTNDPSLEAQAEALNNRTGTVPFMALDLLTEDGPTPRHLYRHDLESFLWILIWAAVHYDIPNKRNLSISLNEMDKELKIWDEGTREEVWGSKHAMLWRASADSPHTSGSSSFEHVLDRVRPEFQKLKEDWIIPLLQMFYRAYNELRYADVDEETCGGIVTFHTFMATINRAPRLVPSNKEEGWNSCVIT